MAENGTVLAELADACLNYLASDVEELSRFLDIAGFTPQTLRAAMGTEPLQVGLVDYFGRNEILLLAMCANSGVDVNQFMRVWNRINPDAWT